MLWLIVSYPGGTVTDVFEMWQIYALAVPRYRETVVYALAVPDTGKRWYMHLPSPILAAVVYALAVPDTGSSAGHALAQIGT